MTDYPATGSLRSLRDQMDSLFDSFFGNWPLAERGSSAGGGLWNPDLEVSENEKEIVVRAELPGIDAKDVDVRVTGNVVTLSGEKKEEKEENQEGYYRSERRYGSFFRSLELPSNTKPGEVTADFDKGVLTLRVPKDEAAAPRKVEVKSAAGKENAQAQQVDVKEDKPEAKK